MGKMKELYHDEVKNLTDFREKVDAHAIYKSDLEFFAEQYEELIAQAKVITRVSDRLQKKLDSANLQIREQNNEISNKNTELESAIQQLVQARVGRKASTILYVLTIGVLILEELFLDPQLDEMGMQSWVSILVKIATAVIAKLFEGKLEGYYLNKEKEKIIRDENGRIIVSTT